MRQATRPAAASTMPAFTTAIKRMRVERPASEPASTPVAIPPRTPTLADSSIAKARVGRRPARCQTFRGQVADRRWTSVDMELSLRGDLQVDARKGHRVKPESVRRRSIDKDACCYCGFA